MSDNNKPTLTPQEIVDRAEAHPAAVPFIWLGSKQTQRNFIYIPLAGMIIFSILGFLYPPKYPTLWESGLRYAAIGFFSYSFVVLMARPLFKLLSRPENYYGEDGEDSEDGEDDIEPVDGEGDNV